MVETLIAWGHDFIVAFQGLRNPLFDALFRTLTFLGEEEFFLVLLPSLFWLLDRAVALRLLVLYLLSTWLNDVAKLLFAQPRPFDPRVVVLAQEESYGLPSGHAQIAATLWGYLGLLARPRWRWAMPVALLLVVGIGLSRIYLGAHFPHDVVLGWLFGAGMVALALWAIPVLEPRIVALPTMGQAALGFGVAAVLALVGRGENAVAVMGVLAGASLGVPIEWQMVRSDPHSGSRGQRIARTVLGLVVLFALWVGLRAVLPEGLLFRFVRYTVLGLWVGLLAPWLFVKLGLATSRLSGGQPRSLERLS